MRQTGLLDTSLSRVWLIKDNFIFVYENLPDLQIDGRMSRKIFPDKEHKIRSLYVHKEKIKT